MYVHDAQDSQPGESNGEHTNQGVHTPQRAMGGFGGEHSILFEGELWGQA